ncbi:MAG: aldehyde ferredoxin oxidoreductase family protein [bacterium]
MTTAKEKMKITKNLATIDYNFDQVSKGYSEQTLYLNLSDNKIIVEEVPEEIKEKYIGGRGYGLKYLWDGVEDDTKWDDEENEIIVSPGPLAGTTRYPGLGKSLVLSISPLTNTVIDSNVGGYFGPLMKFAGFDAMEIQGKADKEVVIYIDGDNKEVSINEVETDIEETHILAEELTEKYADGEKAKRNVSVISSGVGAKNSNFGLLNFSFYDVHRKEVRIKQAGRGGIGSVFRNKKIKAVVVKFSDVTGDSNHPVDTEKITKLGRKINKRIHDHDDEQNKMRKRGTSYLVDVINDSNLLPVKNFKYDNHPEYFKIDHSYWEKKFNQEFPDGCWYGCTMQCAKTIDEYELQTGPYKGDKILLDGPEYETIAGTGSNCGIFNPDHVAEANFYCDTYGIDTISFGTATAFAMECYENGIIDKEITGGLELHFGNTEAAIELLHQMCHGEGFGKVVGQGVKYMKDYFAKEYGADRQFLEDIAMENKGLEYSEYVTKECPSQQLGYAAANKGPQHDEALMFSVTYFNNFAPTIADKAEKIVEMTILRTWFGLVGACKLLWNDIVPVDNDQTEKPYKIPEHVNNYIELFEATTGRETTEEDIMRQSERMHNLQRVFNIRMGVYGRKNDTPPYRAVGPVTAEEYIYRKDYYDQEVREIVGEDDIQDMNLEERMNTLRKHREDYYNELLDAVYEERGWDKNGIPKVETLERLDIAYPDVVEIVEKARKNN